MSGGSARFFRGPVQQLIESVRTPDGNLRRTGRRQVHLTFRILGRERVDMFQVLLQVAP